MTPKSSTSFVPVSATRISVTVSVNGLPVTLPLYSSVFKPSESDMSKEPPSITPPESSNVLSGLRVAEIPACSKASNKSPSVSDSSIVIVVVVLFLSVTIIVSPSVISKPLPKSFICVSKVADVIWVATETWVKLPVV